MPKLGDQVTVQVRGAPESGTSLGNAIKVGPGASMNIPGKIVEDHGDYWVVELSISIGNRNRISVPKSAEGAVSATG